MASNSLSWLGRLLFENQVQERFDFKSLCPPLSTSPTTVKMTAQVPVSGGSAKVEVNASALSALAAAFNRLAVAVEGKYLCDSNSTDLIFLLKPNSTLTLKASDVLFSSTLIDISLASSANCAASEAPHNLKVNDPPIKQQAQVAEDDEEPVAYEGGKFSLIYRD